MTIIGPLLLDNFHPAVSLPTRVQNEKKATNYCIRLGPSLWSAERVTSIRIHLHIRSKSDNRDKARLSSPVLTKLLQNTLREDA